MMALCFMFERSVRLMRRNGFAAAGFVFLLLAGETACATGSGSRRFETPTRLQAADRYRPGWSRLQTVAAGAEVEVRLYDEAKTVEGRFESTSAETLTLLLPDRSVRVIEGNAVHRVQVRRPLAKHRWGWIAFGATAATVSLLTSGPRWDLTNKAQLTFGLLAAAPVSAAVFWAQRMQTLYEAAPAASQFVSRIAVNASDGDSIRRGEEMAVSVGHVGRAGRAGGAPIGVTVCLSSRRERCVGGSSTRYEGPVRDLPNPFTARLAIDEQFPSGASVPLYVHVVVTAGPSWRPSGGQPVPAPGDDSVLDVEMAVRSVRVVDW